MGILGLALRLGSNINTAVFLVGAAVTAFRVAAFVLKLAADAVDPRPEIRKDRRF